MHSHSSRREVAQHAGAGQVQMHDVGAARRAASASAPPAASETMTGSSPRA
jgi:hypothetical protein